MSGNDNEDIGHLDTSVGAPRPAAEGGPHDVPKRVGQFTIGPRLGRGGMATVYLAAEDGTGRQVALKLMNHQLAEDPQFVERFKAEARATSLLQHPNIVGILGWGEANGAPFMATEFCDGGTVGSLVDALGEVPVPVAVEVMAQFLAGLGHAHQRGIVHRDLKPENLLLTKTGEVKLADFGIAKTNNQTRMTNTGMLVGTASYMSPEQARGEMLDGRSDLYSAGIIFYELLAGVNPFDSDNPATSLSKILTNAVTPLVQTRPSVQSELEVIIDKLMAFDALDRFSTAEEALAAMDPLVKQFRADMPGLLAGTLRDPKVAQGQINRRTAQLLYGEAVTLSQQGIPQKRKAAMKLFSATAADPEHADAQKLFEQLKGELNLNFGPATNPKIGELEAQLRSTPGNLQLLTQLSNLYKLEGNVLRASAYLRRYVRLKPEDGYAASQLTQLTGELPQVLGSGAPAGTPQRSGPSTNEIMAGIQTGGFKAGTPAKNATGSQPAGAPQTGVVARRPMAVVPLAEVAVVNPWVALAKRVGPWLIVALVVVGVVRFTMKFIAKSAEDVDKNADVLSDGLVKGELKGLPGIQKVPVTPTVAPKLEAVATESVMTRAKMKMRNGDFEGAVSEFDGLLSTAPDSMEATEAAFLRGHALLGAKRPAAAKGAFADYLTRHPDTADAPEALLMRGRAAEKMLDFSAAEADYTKFISDYPRSKLFGEALLSRAELRHQQGQDELAKGDLVMAKSAEGAPSGIRTRAAELLERLQGTTPP